MAKQCIQIMITRIILLVHSSISYIHLSNDHNKSYKRMISEIVSESLRTSFRRKQWPQQAAAELTRHIIGTLSDLISEKVKVTCGRVWLSNNFHVLNCYQSIYSFDICQNKSINKSLRSFITIHQRLKIRATHMNDDASKKKLKKTYLIDQSSIHFATTTNSNYISVPFHSQQWYSTSINSTLGNCFHYTFHDWPFQIFIFFFFIFMPAAVTAVAATNLPALIHVLDRGKKMCNANTCSQRN